MKISVIQMKTKTGDSEYNYSLARSLLIKAAQYKPQVIVLPETWNTGFFPRETLNECADINGERAKALLREISLRYNVNIIGGSISEKRADGIYNTCHIFNGQGENIASYSKAHLFSPMNEHMYYKKGNDICTFYIDNIKCAVAICYDIRFPELIRQLALSGAKILFVPMQWPKERIRQMELLIKARAVENQMYAVACNSCEISESTAFGGNSLIASALGEDVIRAGEDEEIITLDLDFADLDTLRREIDVFSDRRTDIY